MQKRDVIKFEPDTAVTVALKYTTGRAVSGTYGPQMMYTTVDDRIFFLDPPIAASLEALKPAKGEAVRLAKIRRGGSNTFDWDIERVGNGNPQAVETFAKTPDNISGICKAPDTAMAACFRAALDAVAEAQEYSNRKALGIAFTSDNLTSAALSAYIAKTREGRAA